MKSPARRETTQVTANSSLVSDKKTCSQVNNNENMPRRGNRCDIVSGRRFPEIFRSLGHVVGNLSETNVWQVITSYGRQTTQVAADSSLVSEKKTC